MAMPNVSTDRSESVAICSLIHVMHVCLSNLSVAYQLRPSIIQSLTNLLFVPYDPTLPTRRFGSSSVVCVTAGMMTVTSWLRTLFAPSGNTAQTTGSSTTTTTTATKVTDESDDSVAQSSYAFPNYTKVDMTSFWEPDDTITSAPPAAIYWLPQSSK
jgi:hypothetical protein